MEEVLHALCAPSRIRNVCVIAHVDHGKTSICDHLVASNGYIAAKLAGKTRYMDSREDEQQRLITIKSSSIPLLYKPEPAGDAYVVNLIDSPGHVDFSVEVSAATRLCDSALVVVDVIEGLRSQTKTVLRQAVSEGLQLLLVLNKVDRLFCEIKMTPGNAYTHMRDVIENINAHLHKCVQDAYANTITSDDELDAIYDSMAFEPGNGNVLFCSANDGWCFDLRVVARRILKASKLDADEAKIQKMMKYCWGDWSLNAKTGQVSKKLGNAEMTIAASQFLRPMEQIYKLVTSPPSDLASALPTVVERLARFFEIELTDRDIRDWLKKPQTVAAGILSKWSPLGPFLLGSIVRSLPSPLSCHASRMEKINRVPSDRADAQEPLMTEEALAAAPCVLFVAKSVHANFEQSRLTSDCLHGRETANDFVGFSRVFEGTLRVGDVVYPARERLLETSVGENDTNTRREMTVRKLFAPVGMDLMPTDEVRAGAIVCIAFDEDVSAESNQSVNDTMAWLMTLRNTPGAVTRRDGGFTSVDRCVTIAANPDSPPLVNIYSKHPIGAMRFGVSPVQLTSWQDFVRGLALLYRADPAVAIEVVSETGEFVICCQGQVHYERIIQDFEKLYCPGIPLRMTPPLISLRETVIDPPTHIKLSAAAFGVPFPPWVPGARGSAMHQALAQWQWSQATAGCSSSAQSTYVKATAEPMNENLLRFLDDEAAAISDIVHARELSGRALALCSKLSAELDPSLPAGSPQVASVEECNVILLRHVQKLLGGSAECVAVSLAGDGRTVACLVPDRSTEKPPPPASDEGSDGADPSREQLTLDQLAIESNLRSETLMSPTIDLGSSVSSTKRPASSEPCLDFDVLAYNRKSAALCVRHALDSATRRGPICEEPVRGVCWVVKSMFTTAQEDAAAAPSAESASEAPEAATTVQVASVGPLIGSTRSAFRNCLIARGCVRLWELMAKLEVSCSENALGRVHDVLSSRRGVVLSQAMLETTFEFILLVEMPACETFDLAVEMRKHASFIPITTYWKLNSEDPFEESVVTTVSEEDEGTQQRSKQNVPRRLVNQVRERKGLPTGLKVMDVGADKQRTLKR